MVARFLGEVSAMVGGIGAILLTLLVPIGSLYWIWVSIQLGSFMMFVLGVLPPFFVVAAPLGIYMLLFGVPTWIVNMFG